MKGKVLKKFRDKQTKSIYAVGDVIERDEARIAEINKVKGGPFIAVIEEAESTGESSAAADENAPAAGEKKSRTPRSKKTKE
jgi:hypothetical protein